MPELLSSDWTWVAGQHHIFLVFDQPMATDDLPVLGSMELIIDTVVTTIDNVSWFSDTIMEVVSDFGDRSTSFVRFELLNKDPGLANITHQQVLPFFVLVPEA